MNFRSGSLKCVKMLLEANPKSLHSMEYRLRTPIHYAASEGHAHIIKFLLDQGANPDQRYAGRRQYACLGEFGRIYTFAMCYYLLYCAHRIFTLISIQCREREVLRSTGTEELNCNLFGHILVRRKRSLNYLRALKYNPHQSFPIALSVSRNMYTGTIFN